MYVYRRQRRFRQQYASMTATSGRFPKAAGFRGNLCSWIGYTRARRSWRWRTGLRFSSSWWPSIRRRRLRRRRSSSLVVVGPELILSFNGTYRAVRFYRRPSYSRFSGPKSHGQPDSIPLSASNFAILFGPIARFSGRTHATSNPKVVWVSTELIVHEYHNQGCTLYRILALPTIVPSYVYRSKLS